MAVIKVSEIPEGATEDALTLFFENRRKFGGGNIESCSLDETNGTAFITFEEPEGINMKIMNSIRMCQLIV